MADEVDIANEVAAQHLSAAIASRVQPPRAPYEGDCTDCGEGIDPARAALGYCTCIDCAQRNEFAAAGRAH